jgi:hypothetical protein
MGGGAPVAGAAAGQQPRHRQAGRTGPHRSPQGRARTDNGAVLRPADVLSPAKITIKGAPAARRWRDGASATLDGDLCQQDLGTSQEDGNAEGRAVKVRPKQPRSSPCGRAAAP